MCKGAGVENASNGAYHQGDGGESARCAAEAGAANARGAAGSRQLRRLAAVPLAAWLRMAASQGAAGYLGLRLPGAQNRTSLEPAPCAHEDFLHKRSQL